MTSATDNRTTELREKLDERGVEHYDGTESTLWLKDEHGYRASADELSSGRLSVHIWCDTPEQAIAATLGSGTLTAEQVREAVMSADRWEKPMGDTGLTNTHLIIRDDEWQAIADELNAALGGGECTPHGEWKRVSQTQEVRHVFCDCGHELGMDERDSFPFKRTRLFAMPNYCKECGRRILKAVKR